MSTKPKYKAKPELIYDGYDVVNERGQSICTTSSLSSARKIARALSAMEANKKPKPKPFAFDWSGIDPKYKWAAMDSDEDWPLYVRKPRKPAKDSPVWPYGDDKWTFCRPRPTPYPGDWRDSLQKRP